MEIERSGLDKGCTVRHAITSESSGVQVQQFSAIVFRECAELGATLTLTCAEPSSDRLAGAPARANLQPRLHMNLMIEEE